jgi:HemY protein
MRLWSFIIVLITATVAGIYIRHDPGYALFAYKGWTIEMPLWLAVVSLMVGIVILIGSLWFLNTLFSSKYRLQSWWFKHKQQLSRIQTSKGLLELTEGHWKKAELYLSRSARFSDTPLINYLSAALAAEEGGATDRRDRYLQLAYHASEGSDVAVRLTEAQLRFKRGEHEQSIATLQHLHAEQPKHPQVLKLLSSIYEATQDWRSLLHLLPELRKSKVFSSKEQGAQLEQKIYQALLPLSAEKGKDSLIQFWNNAPTSVYQDANMVSLYAKLLLEKGADIEAESLLRNLLKKTCQDDWIRLYGLAKGQPKKQLKFAETLLDEQPNNPVLLLTLGRLCLNEHLWGKARAYLERHISLQPTTIGYSLLAELMDRLGFPEKRNDYYKKGLASATNALENNDSR